MVGICCIPSGIFHETQYTLYFSHKTIAYTLYFFIIITTALAVTKLLLKVSQSLSSHLLQLETITDLSCLRVQNNNKSVSTLHRYKELHENVHHLEALLDIFSDYYFPFISLFHNLTFSSIVASQQRTPSLMTSENSLFGAI